MSSLKRKAASQASNGDSKKPKPDGSIMSFFGAPKAAAAPSSSPSTSAANGANGKPTNGASSSTAASSFFSAGGSGPAIKFDKVKWVKSLTPEQRQLLALEITTMHESWLAYLKDELTTPKFLELKRFLDNETKAGRKWFPPKEDVYSWSRHTPLNTVKVVILGQDPYHNVNQAHGLAFSVRPPTPAPPSLKNMYIALRNDYPGDATADPPVPGFNAPAKNSGLLTPWADRGVLLLNTCLTVRAHSAKSHADRGWERLTTRVLELVAAKRPRGVVFMAWGTPAAKCVARVDAKKHLVLKSAHPSPLSAARGFFTCGHFKTANDWLVQRYGKGSEVDWALVEGESVLPKPVEPKSEPKEEKKEGEDIKVEEEEEKKRNDEIKVKKEEKEEAVAVKEEEKDGEGTKA